MWVFRLLVKEFLNRANDTSNHNGSSLKYNYTLWCEIKRICHIDEAGMGHIWRNSMGRLSCWTASKRYLDNGISGGMPGHTDCITRANSYPLWKKCSVRISDNTPSP